LICTEFRWFQLFMFIDFFLDIYNLVILLIFWSIYILHIVSLYYIFIKIWKLTFLGFLYALTVGNNCYWVILNIYFFLPVWNWNFTCQYFYIILSDACIFIWLVYWNAVCFCFQKVFIFFNYFVKFVYYFCCISLILSLNSFSFLITVFDLCLLLLFELINQNQTHIKFLLSYKMLVLRDRAVAWQVSDIIGNSVAA